MIERPWFSIRIFGKNDEKITAESASTVFANGNGLVIIGDSIRRTVMCTLDSGLEKPQHREFKGDPKATILADRGKYIAAALTAVRAYIAAGHPGELKRLASFEEWSDNIRSALVWYGYADPVASMDEAEDSDPNFAQLVRFLANWYRVLDDKPVSLIKAIERASGNDAETWNLMKPAGHIPADEDFRAAMMEISATRDGPSARS